MRPALVGCLGLVLCGCAVTEGRLYDRCSASALLSSLDSHAALPPEKIEAEIGALRKSTEEGGSDCDRLRLAFLCLLPSGKRNDALAQKLLEDAGSRSEELNPGVKALAAIVSRVLREKGEVEARNRTTGKKLSEEQARSDALRKQIDELRAIERIIEEREKR